MPQHFPVQGCGKWKPADQFLDGSKRCNQCRLFDIEQREQAKWNVQVHCYVCGQSTPRGSASTNGLKPYEYFCSEECARVLNVMNKHDKYHVTWTRAKEQVFHKSRTPLDRYKFFRKCDDVKSGRLQPGTFQEFIEWTAATPDPEENPIASNRSDDDDDDEYRPPSFKYGNGYYPDPVTDQHEAPPTEEELCESWWPQPDNPSEPTQDYDSWWANAIEQTASNDISPILGEDWNDPEKFNVRAEASDNKECVDYDF